jgi:hypothetical protein
MAWFKNTSEGIGDGIIAVAVSIVLVALLGFIYYLQRWDERPFAVTSPIATHDTSVKPKEQYEIYKLAEEIRSIRSDTNGSLFWMKVVRLLITVGGAIGGYLVGQNKATKRKLSFEHKKDVDLAYQNIINELSGKEDLLRASAAVKLGSILEAFPAEWKVNNERKEQITLLTRQVLVAALFIEGHPKVRKMMTISLKHITKIVEKTTGRVSLILQDLICHM